MALHRILVANRGEIARRIIRGAHDAGCEAVAVYAADDAASPYAGEADAAVLLPGSSLRETYLDPEALLAAARTSGADALHPGYGFLSENPALPEACARAGVVWIGPPPEAMRVMGHKARAKEVVAAAGVPVLPSAVVPAGAGEKDVGKLAAGVGYPLLVKASAGGGGRGMRLVEAPGELAEAVAAAQREAAAAFGSDEVFVERYLSDPRHVEVQIVGDTKGNVLHLFDRECSVQRRHQKVVEEAPAVFVAEDTRRAMWEAAVAAAKAVEYVGVGTVEYLVDGSGFWFLEMNTRLQVEHGVTELVTGLDLVGLQIGVAAGRALGFGQEAVATAGHAVEVRLCAERPSEGYRPTPGTAGFVRWPVGEAWTGVRVDAGIESGSVVSPAYDSLVAKVMAWGEDRAAAIGRLGRAVRGVGLDGIETNRELLGAVLDDGAFGAGEIDIHYLEARPDLRDAALSDDVRARHAAAAGFALLEARAAQSLVPVAVGAAGWRNVGRAQHADELRYGDGSGSGSVWVRVGTTAGPAEVRFGDADEDAWRVVGTASTRDGVVDLVDADGLRRRYEVRLGAHGAFVNGPEGQSSFGLRTEDDVAERGGVAGECRAPLPGSVTKVLVSVGDVVGEGDGLVVLEAMKMEHTLRAHGAGTVRAVHGAPGQQVDAGELLVEVQPA